MSFSTKILLFAAVGIGVTCVLGGLPVMGARSGRVVRERVIDAYEEAESLDEIESGVWPYLSALGEASRTGQDTTSILGREQARVREVSEKLHGLEQRVAGLGGDSDELTHRRENLEQVLQEFRQWIERAESHLRLVSRGGIDTSSVEWVLYQDYFQHVGLRIATLDRQEVKELDRMRRQWDAAIQRTLVTCSVMTCGCILLMVMFALVILRPLRGSLRTLRTSAERIGRGDFDIRLPPMGGDELGLLAGAMTSMASELRTTLHEKQRLVQIEVSEQEARRYNSLLEETVRTRTLELEESLRQLQTTQQQLLFADRLASMGRLAAGVAHEINNPLAFILSNLNFIRQELERVAGSSPELQELRDVVHETREGAERVRLIVRDLKTLSRPDDVALGLVELEQVVRGTIKLVMQELRERARLVVDCASVPRVWGNGPRLGQVLLNLLLNAAHAIAPGAVERNEVCVLARTGLLPGHVTLEVRDTGSGIAPENLSRIFEPFFTTKPVGGGTGLGLSVCRGIISSMGGSIQVESQVGRGTTFRVHLRLEPPEGTLTPTSKGKREELLS